MEDIFHRRRVLESYLESYALFGVVLESYGHFLESYREFLESYFASRSIRTRFAMFR